MKQNDTFKQEKKKLPFNALSKKGLTCLALTGVLATTPLVFAGCSSSDSDLYIGTRTEVGTSYDSFKDARIGDLFIDTDDYIMYRKGENGWEIVIENFGKPGESAETIELQVGEENIQWKYKSSSTWQNLISIASLKGSNGSNGYTPYIENGFWYINSRNTGVKAEATDAREISIRTNGTAIQWQHVGDLQWYDLVQLSSLKGVDGTNGVNGSDGTKWYSGTTNPTAENTANDGDFYLNTTSFNLFKMTDGAWVSVGNMKAKDGTTWYHGATEPQNTQGIDGDFYLDTLTFNLYQKANGTWQLQGCIKAQDGTDGATWSSGSATLSQLNNADGKDGDFYLNTETYDIYTKTNGAWTFSANIKSHDGKDGQDGTKWYSGTVEPNASTSSLTGNENVGDFYLNTTNYNLYQKTKNGWSSIGSIAGASIQIQRGATAIQWKYTTSNTWNDLIAIADLKGADGANAPYIGEDGTWWIGLSNTGIKAAGTDGREIELRVDETTQYIQWQYKGDTNWTNLFNLSTLKGADGATWLSGEGVPTNDSSLDASATKLGKNGDFYLNTETYDIYKKTDGTWNIICNIKGNDGENGTKWHCGAGTPSATLGSVGDFYFDNINFVIYSKTASDTWTMQGGSFKGQNGQNGTSVYIGYDGYIWQGGIRTDFKAVIDETGNEDVWEDTLGAYKYMKDYFASSYVDLSTNCIALMQYYTNISDTTYMTIYGGTTVKEITVVSDKAGTLRIGKAKVSDVVNARQFGANNALTVTDTQAYTVVGGVNTITFSTPLVLADDETIVLGGSDTATDENTDETTLAKTTVGLFVAQGIPVADEVGNFSLINGENNSNVISSINTSNNNYADTLAIKVRAYKANTSVFSNLTTLYADTSTLTAVSIGGAPYGYANNSKFAGRKITRIGVALANNSLKETDNDYYTMTIYKFKTSIQKSFNTYGEEIVLKFPKSTTTAEDIGSWVYVDCDIDIAEDESLAFGKSDDTLLWGYSRSFVNSDYIFYGNAGGLCNTAALLFDIQVQGTKAEALEEYNSAIETAKKNSNITS